MANPQPVPFVQFSKELFDALLLSGMPATHKEIVLAVIRRTYGDHSRKAAAISQTLLQQMTGRARSGIRKGIQDLIREKVLVQVSPPSFAQSAVLGLNKDYEAWGKWSVPSATVLAEGQDVSLVDHDVPGQCHHGGTGEGHHGGTIEYIETLEERKDLPKEDAAAVAGAREGDDEERSSSIDDQPLETPPSLPDPLDDDDPMDALLIELWEVEGWKRHPREDRAALVQLGAAFHRADLATAIQQLQMKALDGAVKANLRSALQAFVKQLHLQTPEPREPVEPEPPPRPLTSEEKESIRSAMREAALLAQQGSREMRL